MTGGSSASPDEVAIERAALLEVSHRQTDFHRLIDRLRRARNHDELDPLVLGIDDHRAASVRCRLKLRRRIAMLDEPRRERPLVGKEEREDAQPAHLFDRTRGVLSRGGRGLQLDLAAAHNHFDTAADYGDAELRLGPMMGDIRDRIFLATKTGLRTEEEAWAQINRSLERLQTDHVDLIQMHAVCDLAELDLVTGEHGSLRAAIRAKEEGLVGRSASPGTPTRRRRCTPRACAGSTSTPSSPR